METLSRLLLTFLLNSLWQVPLIAAVAWLISKLLGRGPASHRHAVWMLALASSLALPLASVRLSETPAPYKVELPTAAKAHALRGIPRSTTSQSLLITVVPADSAQIHVGLENVTARVLLVAYMLFLLFRFTMLGLAFAHTSRIRRTSAPAPPSLLVERIWNRTAAVMRIESARLRVSQNVAGPVMIGAWKKDIILPESLLHETSEEVLTTALGHEMAHIARHDYLLNIVAELLCLPLAFQPASLLMRRALTRSRELACDELVTLRLLDPAAYARSILTLAHDVAGLPRPAGYSLGVFDGNILEERIKKLLNRPFANLKRARILLATGLLTLAVCVVAVSSLAISARAQSAALPEMDLAQAAFNSGNFPGAAEHFQRAVNLDPDDLKARLLLARALTQDLRSQPGGGAAPDDAVGWMPILRQYEEVLRRDHTNRAAILGIATLDSTALWQPSHARLAELISADPQNRAAYYATGVMDWKLAFQPIRQAFGGNAQTAGLIPDAALRQSLREKYTATIYEGVRMMQVALQLSPAASDAMAYLNLLYREAASVADTDKQSKELLVKADALVKEALGGAEGGFGIGRDIRDPQRTAASIATTSASRIPNR